MCSEPIFTGMRVASDRNKNKDWYPHGVIAYGIRVHTVAEVFHAASLLATSSAIMAEAVAI